MFVREPDQRTRKIGRPPGPSTAELRVCSKHGLVAFHYYKASGRWRCKRCVGEAVTRRHRRSARGRWRRPAALRDLRRRVLHDQTGTSTTSTRPRSRSRSNAMKGKSLQAFRAEARKCFLLCANCHGEVESGLARSPPAGAVYRG